MTRQRRLKEEESKSNLMFWNVAWLLINGVIQIPYLRLILKLMLTQHDADADADVAGDPHLLRCDSQPEAKVSHPHLLPL